MSRNFSKYQQKAIQEWMARTVIPLLYDDPSGQLDSYGSGVLIESNGNVLFATARHNLFFPDQTTRRELTRLAISVPDREDPGKNHPVFTLGPFDLLWPSNSQGEDIDVALLHLKDQDIIAALRKSWNVVDRSKAVAAPLQGSFVLSGYPSDRVRVTSQGICGSLNTIYTERMLQNPQNATQPVDSDYDLFFHYDLNATDLEGNVVKTPAAPGMSGSVVWELYRTDDEVWAPEKVLKMVAIQSSWLKGNFVRAKSWAYVEHILNESKL